MWLGACTGFDPAWPPFAQPALLAATLSRRATRVLPARRTYSDMAGPEAAKKYQNLIFLAGSASAEFFADIALCPFEAVKVPPPRSTTQRCGAAGGGEQREEGERGTERGSTQRGWQGSRCMRPHAPPPPPSPRAGQGADGARVRARHRRRPAQVCAAGGRWGAVQGADAPVGPPDPLHDDEVWCAPPLLCCLCGCSAVLRLVAAAGQRRLLLRENSLGLESCCLEARCVLHEPSPGPPPLAGAFENVVQALYKYVVPKPKAECSKPEQLGVSFAAGYIAGIFCAVVSHPADNLVSKMNASKGLPASELGCWVRWSLPFPLPSCTRVCHNVWGVVACGASLR